MKKFEDITGKIIGKRNQKHLSKSFESDSNVYAVNNPIEVGVFDNGSDLDAFIAEQIGLSLAQSKEDGVMLSTGNTYPPIYAQMKKDRERFRELLSGRPIANVDEVWKIDNTHPNVAVCYREYMRKNLFEPLGLSEENWIIPDGTTADPQSETELFEHRLQSKEWHLAAMGIGPDSVGDKPASPHIGFIPVGTPPEQSAMFVELDEATYENNRKDAPLPDQYYTHSITMGPADYARAKNHILVAKGSKKKNNMRQVLLENVDVNCPASQVLLYPQTRIFMDRLAAELVMEEISR